MHNVAMLQRTANERLLTPEQLGRRSRSVWLIFAALAAELLGARWMFGIFFFTAFTGSIFHVVLNAGEVVPMLGASGAVMGFEGAYLGLATRWHLPEPHIWPMSRPVPPGQLALIGVAGVAIDYFSLMSHAPGNIAYGAHLGGFVGAWFYLVYLDRRAGTRRFRAQTVAPVAKQELLNWKRVDASKVHEVNRDEVNRILDKISAMGIASLTAQERLFLSNFVPPDDRVPPVS